MNLEPKANTSLRVDFDVFESAKTAVRVHGAARSLNQYFEDAIREKNARTLGGVTPPARQLPLPGALETLAAPLGADRPLRALLARSLAEAQRPLGGRSHRPEASTPTHACGVTFKTDAYRTLTALRRRYQKSQNVIVEAGVRLLAAALAAEESRTGEAFNEGEG